MCGIFFLKIIVFKKKIDYGNIWWLGIFNRVSSVEHESVPADLKPEAGYTLNWSQANDMKWIYN